MLFKCERCKNVSHLFEITDKMLEWEIGEVSEGSMGIRQTHVAEWEDECPKCRSSVSATFTTWEYPEGVEEDSDAEYDGISPVNPNEKLRHDVSFKDED